MLHSAPGVDLTAPCSEERVMCCLWTITRSGASPAAARARERGEHALFHGGLARARRLVWRPHQWTGGLWRPPPCSCPALHDACRCPLVRAELRSVFAAADGLRCVSLRESSGSRRMSRECGRRDRQWTRSLEIWGAGSGAVASTGLSTVLRAVLDRFSSTFLDNVCMSKPIER